MADLCNDGRFELIEKYKLMLMESTNINDSEDELKVLDTILFRFWQMGWLDKLEQPSAQQWIPCSERLPEKEGWYITTVESEKTGKRRIENDLFAIDIALAHGHTPNKFCKDGYRQRTVAWCEFPEPWRGES